MPTGFKGFQKRNKINLGKKYSEERNNKISQSLKGRKVWNDGKHWSEETKRKISEARKRNPTRYWLGKKRPELNQNKYREGKKHSEETKKKISENNAHFKYWLGKKLSIETKRKMGESRRGNKNPSWRGGISFEPYGLEFNDDLKEVIRNRDRRKCFICGKTELENKEKLIVHHIDYDKQNNDPKNLISLCRSCHQKTNHNRNYWVDYFKKLKLNN